MEGDINDHLPSGMTLDDPEVTINPSSESLSKTNEVEYKWVDITQEFIESCSQLDLGELLHDANFGLFEGMSAIEMMDPKMDAGMVCNQTKHKVLSFQQAIQVGKVKIDNLTPAELVGIIDDTFSCLVTWLEGHSLAQTVFINLYLHDPTVIIDLRLKSFCICFLKLIDLIRDRISRASVYEEEDFQSMTYGFKMTYDDTDAHTTALKGIEDELHRVIKNTRAKVGSERNSETELEHDLAVAVHSRLKFTRLFYNTIQAFSKDKCQGLEEAQKFLKQMKELMELMKKSVSIGITRSQEDDYPCIMGFEPLVNQRLLPPTFPRFTKIRGRQDTLDYLDVMVTRLAGISTITQYTTLHELLDYFVEFSHPSPCILSRSLLQLTFLPNNRRVFGSLQLTDILRDTIKTFCAPPALLAKSPLFNNVQAKQGVDSFLAQAVRPITNLFQVTGHNRARQRDKWGHLLEEFSTLQDEAEKTDALLNSIMTKQDSGWRYKACFGTWVLYHTLQIMEWYTVAGLELELYSVHEYHYVFWYLCEGLYNWMISTLSRADSFIVENELVVDKGKKKNKKKKKQPTPSCELIRLQGLHTLCGGYYKAVIGLRMDGKLSLPKFDFDCEEVRYNHRFAPFGCVSTPPPMHFMQFKDMTNVMRYDPPLEARDLYAGAMKGFQQAREHFEIITNPSEEVESLIKIVKTNFVVMRILSGGHRKDSTIPPQFDFSLHKIFPVIKLV